MDFSVVLVGAGNMGGAMLRGWLANGLEPANACVVDPMPSPALVELLSESGIKHHTSPDGVEAPDVLLIAVKPQMMDDVLPGLVSLVADHTVVVSVAAGTTLEQITTPYGSPAAIRTMPNTPSLVLRGMTVACPNEHVSQQQRDNVEQLLSAIGKLEWVDDEVLIDAVTAVSGSGPAYVFHLAECMAVAGVEAGLPDELAMTLALGTVSGAGELLRLSTDTPATLRRNVTSPNGTTAAALSVLMAEDGLQPLMTKAIAAAKKRSEELS